MDPFHDLLMSSKHLEFKKKLAYDDFSRKTVLYQDESHQIIALFRCKLAYFCKYFYNQIVIVDDCRKTHNMTIYSNALYYYLNIFVDCKY